MNIPVVLIPRYTNLLKVLKIFLKVLFAQSGVVKTHKPSVLIIIPLLIHDIHLTDEAEKKFSTLQVAQP